MFGSILGTVARVAVLPAAVADAGMDILCGGDGSKRNRNLTDSPLNGVVQLGEAIAEACEEIDK